MPTINIIHIAYKLFTLQTTVVVVYLCWFYFHGKKNINNTNHNHIHPPLHGPQYYAWLTIHMMIVHACM